ncbi:hypothetical protein [Halobaculum marinum]|uniref:Uncharacterized protein n=1 Tax=Halobaculum marinum TaxID=3031996 RepID=A0ABD5WTN4_9EURY|nr:hypothetical protein [Halobaculum sp. DT55]
MTDHASLATRLPLGSEACVSWSVVAPVAPVASVAARSAAFNGKANATGTIGAGNGAAAPAYVPSASIAA